MAELEEDMREAEVECQKVRNQIKEVEMVLSEKKKLFSTTYQLLEDEEKTLTSPTKNQKEAIETPTKASQKLTRRGISNYVPRFMTSTAASRQRQTAAEREISVRARSLRTGCRSSVQFSASQSLSFSDPRFRAMLRGSNKKPRYGDTNPLLMESPKGNALDTKTSSMPRNKIVTSSDPNLRVTLSHHRRRMSDFV